MTETKACLSIAAADCSGGNGCLSDIKTFTALGVYGCACVTAIAVQNGGGMRNLEALSSHLITNQLIAVVDEMKIDAIKIGLCPGIQNIHSVARFLREHADIPVIIDPVAVDAGGLIMLAPESIDAVCNELIPRADLLTPNLREAAILSQIEECLSTDDMRYAAEKIFNRFGTPCVITGGGMGNKSVHIYCGLDGLAQYEAEYDSSLKRYGAGSVYAAAITAQIAQGESHREAIAFGLHYVNNLPTPSIHSDVPGRPLPLFPQPPTVDHTSTGAYGTVPDVQDGLS